MKQASRLHLLSAEQDVWRGEKGGGNGRRGNLNCMKNSHDIHLVIAVLVHPPPHRLETDTIKTAVFQNVLIVDVFFNEYV